MIRVGTILGSCRLLERVGDGPFGEVWRGKNAEGVNVAVKLLRVDRVEARRAAASFDQIIARWNQASGYDDPRVVGIRHIVKDPQGQRVGVASAFVVGQDLSAVRLPPPALTGADPRSVAVLLGWFQSLGEALVGLHARGLVHGNLKPTNVMLQTTQTGRQIRILDLCWSALGPSVHGPVGFTPPELIQGEMATPATDQWVVGAMLRSILSGGQEALRYGSMPAILVQMVERACSARASDRFPDLSILLQQLSAIRQDLQESAAAQRAVRAASWRSAPEPQGSVHTVYRLNQDHRLIDEPTEPIAARRDPEIDLEATPVNARLATPVVQIDLSVFDRLPGDEEPATVHQGQAKHPYPDRDHDDPGESSSDPAEHPKKKEGREGERA
ncbi:MAG: protein kinase [Deltaproteobacteria bacterium]|nr:protein kinase [Deltaproteobacteria bacterium]